MNEDHDTQITGDEPGLGEKKTEVSGNEVQLGADTALLHTVEMLHHPEPEVRRRAAGALTEHGDIRVFDSLVTILEGDDVPMVARAARALGEIGDRKAVQPLLEAVHKWSTDDTAQMVLYSACEALGKLKDAQAFEPLLELALTHEHSPTRRGATNALKAIDGRRAYEEFIEASHSISSLTRLAVIEALEEFKEREAVPVLIEALCDNVVELRRAAAQALSFIPDERATDSLLLTLKDEETVVRQWAACALGHIRDSKVVKPLIDALNTNNSDVKHSVILSLGQIGDTRAVDPLLAILANDTVQMRYTAASALGMLADPRAIEPLFAVLEETTEEAPEEIPRAVYWALSSRDSTAMAPFNQTGWLMYYVFQALIDLKAPDVKKRLQQWIDDHRDRFPVSTD